SSAPSSTACSWWRTSRCTPCRPVRPPAPTSPGCSGTPTTPRPRPAPASTTTCGASRRPPGPSTSACSSAPCWRRSRAAPPARLPGPFREPPEAARRLCLLLGTSRLLSIALERHPDLIPALGDDRRLLRASTRADLGKAAATLLSWRHDDEQRRAGLQNLKRA